MSKKPSCDRCKWYGHIKNGCFFGGNPNRSDDCLHPNQFVEKLLPPHRWGPSPAVWHMVHEKPKGQEVSFQTKSGKQIRFTKRGKKK